eukprot:9229673-Pyramimonas_sp.AAC.1
MGVTARDEQDRKGIAFMQLRCDIALYQLEHGRDFVLEHPLSASSWGLECIRVLATSRGVVSCVLDQC